MPKTFQGIFQQNVFQQGVFWLFVDSTLWKGLRVWDDYGFIPRRIKRSVQTVRTR